MKGLGARNVFKGKVTALTEGLTTTNVKIDLGHGMIITSSITVEAAKDLNLKKGDDVYAIVKVSAVIIGKD
jgi:molybdopterin-binding protein